MNSLSLVIRPFNLFIFFSIVYFAFGTFAQVSTGAPGACECQFAHKDYDAEKGYYFDRVTYLPFPQVSARFGCVYYCQDSAGGFWNVTHVLEESHFGVSKGGVANAKKFICPNSVGQFIPRHDPYGELVYYETTPYGNFSAAKTSIPEVREWSAACQ
jgi:hypothetical protein